MSVLGQERSAIAQCRTRPEILSRLARLGMEAGHLVLPRSARGVEVSGLRVEPPRSRRKLGPYVIEVAPNESNRQEALCVLGASPELLGLGHLSMVGQQRSNAGTEVPERSELPQPVFYREDMLDFPRRQLVVTHDDIVLHLLSR